MGIYLNPKNKGFAESIHSEIYVDKSGLIACTSKCINSKEKYICVSRPRRFGKSMALEMLAAYYSRGCDSRELFAGLKIERDRTYEEHLNKYDVIYLNVQHFLIGAGNLQKKYLDFLRNLLKDQPYVALAYMTGILPVKKYGQHSALNMFWEFSMTDQNMFEEYTGFTETEVQELCKEYGMDFAEIRSWFCGCSISAAAHSRKACARD